MWLIYVVIYSLGYRRISIIHDNFQAEITH